jgi:hypothetical protein
MCRRCLRIVGFPCQSDLQSSNCPNNRRREATLHDELISTIDQLVSIHGTTAVLRAIHQNLLTTGDVKGSAKHVRAADHLDRAIGQIRCIDGI